MNTRHYTNDRTNRENIINIIGGDGEKFKSYFWDRGHKNGPEVHIITTNAIILIYNYNTKKLITKLIARHSQLKRYFHDLNTPEVRRIYAIARNHQAYGYNEM